MRRSWDLELNPGGEVVGFQVPDELEHRVTDNLDKTNRLLSREEALWFDSHYERDERAIH